jgi:hypothetical protein
LSDAEIATIANWVDNGAPRGDDKDAPKTRVFPAAGHWQFGEEPDLIVTSPGVTVPATGPDLYPEPEAPTDLTDDRYIKWIQVLPGDPTVVHHTLVFAVQDKPSNGMPQIPGLGTLGAGSVLALTRQENGVARIVTSMLTEYARGNDGDIFDQGQAKMLAADSSLRWQFHYHPNGKAQVIDRTRVGIKFWPKGWQPTSDLDDGAGVARTFGNRLAIRVAERFVFSPAHRRGSSAISYMHYRGKRMALEAILPTGRSRN